MVPGNNVSIARQFIRCCIHQLAPNGIFPMLFQSNFEGKAFARQDQDSLLVKRRNDNHSPGTTITHV